MIASGLLDINRGLWTCLLFLGLATGQSYADNMKVELLLVWGCTGEKPSNPAHKPLDKDLADELKRAFKWKEYFVINRTNVMLNSRELRKVEMSKKCVIEIKALQEQRVQVQLFGEGKPRDKVIKPLPKNKSITFGGEAENKCAWFVIVRQID